MKVLIQISILLLLVSYVSSCKPKENQPKGLNSAEKTKIRNDIQTELNEGIEATRTKNIELYMSQMPDDMQIHDESGEIISREKQREYALRDWAIIDTTLRILMNIDSIIYFSADSVFIYTYQEWERIMFQRDGITTDTILTTQRHKETWRKTKNGWFGYEVQELGGKVYINGKEYNPNE